MSEVTMTPFINAFHVGDVITNGITEGFFVVTYVDVNNKAFCAIGSKGRSFIEYMPTQWHPTGEVCEEAIALMNIINRE